MNEHGDSPQRSHARDWYNELIGSENSPCDLVAWDRLGTKQHASLYCSVWTKKRINIFLTEKNDKGDVWHVEITARTWHLVPFSDVPNIFAWFGGNALTQ